MNVAEAMLASADYIEQHGWIQGEAENMQGNVCMIGALDQVLPLNSYNMGDGVFEGVYSALNKWDPARFDRGLVRFNDDIAKNADDVVMAFRECAKDLISREAE